jgi:PAS domain-containing protein
MFKLVAIAGKLRGKEYELMEKENIVGRTPSCDIVFDIVGISSKHLSITVSGDAAYLKDLNSANGTVLNNAMIKSATLTPGDIIILPDLVLKFVVVEEKKIIVRRQGVVEVDEAEEFYTGGKSPGNLPGKIIHLFKYRLMRLIYGINEEYEWKVLLGILLTIFIIINVSVTIFPVIQDSRQILLMETATRGEHYAEEIARLNRRALEMKNLDALDTSFLEKEPGVQSFQLFDMDGRIVRPIQKMNEYISDQFSVRSQLWALETNRVDTDTYVIGLGQGVIGIARTIFVYNSKLGETEKVAIIAIKFAPASLAVEAARNSKAYLEALSTTALTAIIFFAIVYFLTIRPLDEIKYQMNEAFIGKRKLIESNYLMEEVDQLRSGINTLLQRIRELQHDSDESEFGEVEDDSYYIDTLSQFMEAALGPCMILDSQKVLKRLNSEAEDLTGIRSAQGIGNNIMDVAREQGFAATIIELCDQSTNMVGQLQRGRYEISGYNYEILVKGLIGRDNFAKGFYIVFKMEKD